MPVTDVAELTGVPAILGHRVMTLHPKIHGGILADRIGGRPILATGMALQAVALAWLAAIVTPTVAYESMVVPFILAGIGMGLFFASPAYLLGFAALRGYDRHARAIDVSLREG